MFFCIVACRPPAFLAVWGGQTEREAAFADFKRLVALFLVLVGLLAEVGEAAGIGGQPVLQVGVVGVYLDDGACLVKVDFGGLFLFGKSCSHNLSFLRSRYAIGAFFGCFLRLLTWKKQRFSNRKRPDDTYTYPGAAVAKYSLFPALDRQS